MRRGRWWRWVGYMEELEQQMRLHGRQLADDDADLRAQYGHDDWPKTIRDAVEPELLHRAADVPFLGRLIAAARRLPAEVCDVQAEQRRTRWREGETEHARPSAERSRLPGEGAEGERGPPPPRLLAAERALAARTRSLTLVLDRLVNPRNAGAIARSAEYYGLQELHMIQPEGRAALQRAMTRACDRFLDLHWHRDAERAFGTLRERGFHLLVADGSADAPPIERVPLADRVAVVLGSEMLGVSDEARSCADGRFTIRSHGFSSYLNVSNAAVLSVHILDGRMRAEGRRAPLATQDRAALRASWYAALAGDDERRARRYRAWLADPPALEGTD